MNMEVGTITVAVVSALILGITLWIIQKITNI